MGTINVPIAQIKSLPKLMGETDVLKVLQLLPGVQSGGEGTSGLYVRGGSPDQNLILLDGTPVYNAAHLFGFFSVFNADTLNNVELIKGGFPARYGGRLSSVLAISMKEGNMQQLHGEGALSLVASRLTLEGPIKKDVASFIVSARRTYLDVLARPFIKSQLAKEGNAGGLGYTLAWSNRRFTELNQGRIFPYKYDRRHDISLSGTWVYGTGNATTLASGRPNRPLPRLQRLRRPQFVSDGGLPPLRPRPEPDQEKALGRSYQQPVYL